MPSNVNVPRETFEEFWARIQKMPVMKNPVIASMVEQTKGVAALAWATGAEQERARISEELNK